MESWKASFFWVKMKYPATAFPGAPTAFKRQKKYFHIIKKFSTIPGNEIFAKHLLAQALKAAFSTCNKDDKLLGIMELCHPNQSS
jgi:hypothetical protein